MRDYLAIFGNGTRRIFTADSYGQACEYAQGYSRRHGCGMVCNVTAY